MQAAPYRSYYQQGKSSTEVWLVHLSSYKQGLAWKVSQTLPSFALAWVFPGNRPTHISIKVTPLTSLRL